MSVSMELPGGLESTPRPRAHAPAGSVGERAVGADAFAELYAAHRDALYRYCYRKTADPGLVEDIVQDVFEKAFAARHQFDGRRDFWPWLAAIAARACIDAHRRAVSAAIRHDQYGRDTHRQPEDVTANAVLQALDRQTLRIAMAELPPRQRAVLGLSAIDGWSYEQISHHFGCSITAVKTLICRARATLRETTGRLAGVLGLARLRWARLHSGLARMHPTSWPWEALWSPAGSAALTACALALAATSAPAGPLGPGSPLAVVTPDDVGAVEPATAREQPVDTSERTAGHRPSDERDRRGGNTAVDLGVADLVAPVPDPTTGGAEDIRPTSFATSSGQDDDRTIVVAGDIATYNDEVKPRLLVSHDDGETWERRRALGLAPVTKLLLPPAYPRDARLFALTTAGIQVSHDDGETFEVLAPVAGGSDVAASPDFNRGDPRILVAAGGRVLEYDDESSLLVPVQIDSRLAGHLANSVAFVVEATGVRTVVVGTRLPPYGMVGPSGLYVNRCTEAGGAVPALSACETFELPRTSTAQVPLRLPAMGGSNALYVPFVMQPYVSFDGGRTFRAARPQSFEEAEPYWANDLATFPSGTGESAVIAQTTFGTRDGQFATGAQIALTDDGGRSWRPSLIDLPDFPGARAVTVTRSGRIIAASTFRGIACSTDRGATWARTCSPGGAAAS